MVNYFSPFSCRWIFRWILILTNFSQFDYWWWLMILTDGLVDRISDDKQIPNQVMVHLARFNLTKHLNDNFFSHSSLSNSITSKFAPLWSSSTSLLFSNLSQIFFTPYVPTTSYTETKPLIQVNIDFKQVKQVNQ